MSDIQFKPYPSEHSCRLNPPDKYDRFARKNCFKKHEGKCIDFVFGIKGDKSEVQAMRYPKKVWEAAAAKAHCKDAGGSFEAATEEDSAGGNTMRTILVRTKDAKGESALSDMTLDGLVGWFKAHSAEDGTVKEEIIVYRDATIAKQEGKQWVMSDMTLDRDQEQIDPEGWDLKEFKKNPVLLWSHEWMRPAIGHIDNAKIDKKIGALVGEAVFDPQEVDEFAWMIGQKVELGTIRAGSVGFKPIKVEIPADDDDKESDKTKKPKRPRLIYRKQELWEFSICNIPSNPNARVQESADKIVDDSFPAKEKPVWSIFGNGTKQGVTATVKATPVPAFGVPIPEPILVTNPQELVQKSPEEEKPLAEEPKEEEKKEEIEIDTIAEIRGVLDIFAKTLNARIDDLRQEIHELAGKGGVADPPRATFYDGLFAERKATSNALAHLFPDKTAGKQ